MRALGDYLAASAKLARNRHNLDRALLDETIEKMTAAVAPLPEDHHLHQEISSNIDALLMARNALDLAAGRDVDHASVNPESLKAHVDTLLATARDTPEGRLDHALATSTAAMALVGQAFLTRDRHSLDHGISMQEEVCATPELTAHERLSALGCLSMSLRTRYEYFRHPRDLNDAIDRLEQAELLIQQNPPDGADAAPILHLLGDCYHERADPHRRDRQRAVEAGLQALRERANDVPLQNNSEFDAFSQARHALQAAESESAKETAWQRWQSRLNNVCDWAWTAAMGEVLSVLSRPQSERRLVLVPAGELGTVPWHAARRRMPGGELRHACQDAVTTYASSARQFVDASRRHKLPGASAPAVVCGSNELPFASEETKEIHRHFYPELDAVRAGHAGAGPRSAGGCRRWPGHPRSLRKRSDRRRTRRGPDPGDRISRRGLWDLRRGAERSRLPQNPQTTAAAVKFSEDGRWLAQADGETLTLWDLHAQPPTARTLAGAGSQVVSLAFSQDGATLVSANGRLIVWWDSCGGTWRADPSGPGCSRR